MRLTLIAAAAVLLAFVLIHPVAEIGMNDDWSFIRTASELASSGHLRYNGWAAPVIGFQAYWGALFLRIAGFSFTAARLSTMLFSLAFVPVLMRLFRIAGLQQPSALFGTLAFFLSPIVLPNSTSFMTDTPAFLLFALCLLAALEAWKSPVGRQANYWILLVCLAGMASGSVRQIYWAATAWFLLVLAVRRLRLAWVGLTAVIAFALIVTRWQNAQPYVSNGSSIAALNSMPLGEAISSGISLLLHFIVTWAVLLLPISICFAAAFRRWSMLPLAIFAGWLIFKIAQPLPWCGNTMTANGVMSSNLDIAGYKPVVLGSFALWLIGTVGLVALLPALVMLSRRMLQLPTESLRFAVLTVPFLFLYLAAIALRGPVYGIYDRYAIPVLAILAVLFLACYQGRTIPLRAWIVLAAYSLFGIATVHDSFSAARARLAAAAGIARTEILAGFEYDCWTQAEKLGYINNDQVDTPAHAYRNAEDCNGSDALQLWWRSLVPDIHADYVLTVSPLADLDPPLRQVPYQTWLPWQTNYINVQHSRTVLTCQSE